MTLSSTLRRLGGRPYYVRAHRRQSKKTMDAVPARAYSRITAFDPLPAHISGVRPIRTIYLAVTTLVHGLFTSMVLLVLADVASPTFNVKMIPAWTGSQAVFVVVTALTVSFALGVVMHTISRGALHEQKGRWTLDILVRAGR